MKGGDVVIIAALKALSATGALRDASVIVVLMATRRFSSSSIRSVAT
jgi:hypothetical protein